MREFTEGRNSLYPGLPKWATPAYKGPHTQPPLPENAKHAIAPQEFGMWVLANFTTVDEVKEGVKSIVVVPTPAPGLGSPQGAVAGAHFFVKWMGGQLNGRIAATTPYGS